MDRALGHCAQEKQRGLQKFPGTRQQAWEGQTRSGGKGLPRWRLRPELSVLLGAKKLGWRNNDRSSLPITEFLNFSTTAIRG